MFRADLVAAVGYGEGVQGGRPPFDPVLMFKILVIQTANNLSDERAIDQSGARRGRSPRPPDSTSTRTFTIVAGPANISPVMAPSITIGAVIVSRRKVATKVI